MATDTLDEVVTWSRRFREAALPFMVVGAWAVAVHGLVRTSGDIDLVVHLPFETRGRLVEILASHGIKETEERIDPQWEKRIAADLPSGMMLEVFFTPRPPVHDREFDRRQVIEVKGEPIPFTSAEDLVLRKLVNIRLRRGQDYDDAVGVIARQGAKLDLAYIRAHAGSYRVGDLLDRAIAEAEAAGSEGT